MGVCNRFFQKKMSQTTHKQSNHKTDTAHKPFFLAAVRSHCVFFRPLTRSLVVQRLTQLQQNDVIFQCSEAHSVLDVLLADFGVYRCNTKLSAETKLVRLFIPFTGFGSVKNDWILMSTAHSSLTHTHPNTHTTLTFGQRKRRAPIVVENGHPNHCKNERCKKNHQIRQTHLLWHRCCCDKFSFSCEFEVRESCNTIKNDNTNNSSRPIVRKPNSEIEPAVIRGSLLQHSY